MMPAKTKRCAVARVTIEARPLSYRRTTPVRAYDPAESPSGCKPLTGDCRSRETPTTPALAPTKRCEKVRCTPMPRRLEKLEAKNSERHLDSRRRSSGFASSAPQYFCST